MGSLLPVGAILFSFKSGGGKRCLGVTGVQRCAFFFSSRRRHTRLVSDWSSDVCSSDLSRRRHTRLVSDWSSDVCSSDTSELQSLTNLVCRLLLEIGQ